MDFFIQIPCDKGAITLSCSSGEECTNSFVGFCWWWCCFCLPWFTALFVCEQSYFGRRAPLVWYRFLDPMTVVVLAVELAGLSNRLAARCGAHSDPSHNRTIRQGLGCTDIFLITEARSRITTGNIHQR